MLSKLNCGLILKIVKNINFKKILYAVLLLALSCVIFVCFAAKKLSCPFIENNLSDFIGVKIEFIKPKTYFNMGLSFILKAEYMNIYDKTKTNKFISIKEPYIEIKPSDILFNKINIKNFSAEDIAITVSKNAEGKIDILNSINIKNLKKLNVYKYNLIELVSKIGNVDFRYIDNELKTDFDINLKNTDIDFSKKNKILKVKQTGTVKTLSEPSVNVSDIFVDIDTNFPLNDLKNGNSKFEIRITDINLKLFNEIFRKYISKDINTLSGTAELKVNNDTENNCRRLSLKIDKPILILKNNKTISPYETVTLDSLFNIKKDGLEIIDLNLLSNELNINSKGEIIKIFSKKPNINLTTKITKTQLNNFTYFLPDNLIFYRPHGIPALKNSNFHAVLDGSINLKLYPLDITGNLKASDVHIPGCPKPSTRNDVNAIFMKDKMRIYTRIYTPNNEYVTIDGISYLDNSLFGKYNVKSTSKIDLAFAKMYLVPIQQIIGFNIGPVPIMDIEGVGNIDIKTKGTIFDAQVFGTFNAQNASAKIDGLDANITKGSCKLIFDNRTLLFQEIKGKFKNSNFTLTGIGNTKGEVDLDVSIEDVSMNELLKVFNNSVVSLKYKFLTKNIMAVAGKLNVKINLKGLIKNYETKEFLNDLLPSGKLEFLENKVILSDKLQAKNINGFFEFGEKQNADFNFDIINSKVNFKFSSQTPLKKIASGMNIKSKISSDNLRSQDLIDTIINSNLLEKDKKEILSQIRNLKFSTKFDIKSSGKVALSTFNLSNLKNNGYIAGLNAKENDIVFTSGLIKLLDNKIFFDNFEAEVLGGKVKFNGSISNYLTKNLQNNFFISLKNLNLESLNLAVQKIKIKNTILNNGLVIAKNDDIKLNSFSFDYQAMPVFLNAQIRNIYTKKNFLANFSTILTEQTADNAINAFLVTPVKIKNEIPINGSFNGQSDNYSFNISAKIPKGADISFGGSNIGDENYDREISGKIETNKNIANIKNLKLVKFIKNQNQKTNAMILLRADGKIKQLNNDIFFENFKILTNNPTNVRILNLIFKKSLLKKGNFECSLNLNGNFKLPKANGRLALFDLDIPLYDAEISDARFNLTNKTIDGEITARNKQSDIKIGLRAQNDFNLPINIEKIDITSNKLDIKEMLEKKSAQSKMSDISPKQEALKPEDIIIKRGEVNFKDVIWDKINAKNLKSDFSFEDNAVNITSMSFDIADGNIEAKGKYSAKKSKIVLNAKMKECDSNILARQFLNMENQIFGKINGTMTIEAKTVDTPENIKDIKSKIDFSIENGKMPKLGSLEYLLRAGNLIKSGIFGLSLNNLIQVLTPYKTGEFEKISGNLQIADAKIQNLEVYSKGRNLSLFLEGDYGILENFANIKIYGKLSQNISNALGKVGNASLNQFFGAISNIADIKSTKKNPDEEKLSKIPPIENDEQNPRYFKVKVSGDINKENYIKSFNWE